jgi:hypothetical protein
MVPPMSRYAAPPVARSLSISLLRRSESDLRHSYGCCRAACERCFFVAPGIPVSLLRTVRFGPLPATNGKPCKAIVEREIPGHFDELGIVTRILDYKPGSDSWCRNRRTDRALRRQGRHRLSLPVRGICAESTTFVVTV